MMQRKQINQNMYIAMYAILEIRTQNQLETMTFYFIKNELAKIIRNKLRNQCVSPLFRELNNLKVIQ